jgi:hypothetical protein
MTFESQRIDGWRQRKRERKSSLRVKFFVKFSFITNCSLSHTDSFFIAEKRARVRRGKKEIHFTAHSPRSDMSNFRLE